jgi:hypothetical protein
VHTGIWWGNLRERDHLQDPCFDGKIIIRWIFRKWKGDMDWINLAQDRDNCKNCNELSGSIKCRELAD